MTKKSVMATVNDWLWQTTNRREVAKDLSDTSWDWLRTPRGLTAVIGFAFFVLFVAPVIVWFVDDGGSAIITLVMVAGVFSVWFLLRRAVRLVADAPDEALDERLVAIRNRIYLSAFRALATVFGFIGMAVLIWAFQADDSGVMTTTLSLTWPQTNAVVWFLYGQVLIWPSLALAIALRQRKVQL